jgi:hypothetical protein
MKPDYKNPTAGLLLGLALFGFACWSTAADAQNGSSEPVENRNSEAARELRQEALKRKSIERREPEEQTPVTGEVPQELLALIYADLEHKTGGDRADFELLRAEAVRWNDGGLGCPEPGAIYQQVMVDGYWVLVGYQGKEYDFRATDRGIFRPCTGPKLPAGVNPVQKTGAPVGAPNMKYPTI